MKILLIMLAVGLGAALPSTAAAQGDCSQLTERYDRLSRTMASNYARGVADNSAPRAAVRATEENTIMLEAQILLTLMQAKKCTLPDGPPSSAAYLGAALACQTELIGNRSRDLPASCKMETWTKD